MTGGIAIYEIPYGTCTFWYSRPPFIRGQAEQACTHVIIKYTFIAKTTRSRTEKVSNWLELFAFWMILHGNAGNLTSNFLSVRMLLQVACVSFSRSQWFLLHSIVFFDVKFTVFFFSTSYLLLRPSMIVI